MATNSLSELIKTIRVGEDGDQAYVRLYGSQVKPCDFRRWFAQVTLTGDSRETDADTVEQIKLYVAEEMTVDEAFKDFCPDYVGPGEFSVAYTKQVRVLKAAAPPVPVVEPASVPESPLEPAFEPTVDTEVV